MSASDAGPKGDTGWRIGDRLFAALADCVKDEERYRRALERIARAETLEEALELARAALGQSSNL